MAVLRSAREQSIPNTSSSSAIVSRYVQGRPSMRRLWALSIRVPASSSVSIPNSLPICAPSSASGRLTPAICRRMKNSKGRLSLPEDHSISDSEALHSCGGVFVTFICTPTLWFYVSVGQVGYADGHISFPLGYPGCPTMPSGAGLSAR